MNLMNTNPSMLTEDELLNADTLVATWAKKAAIYNKTTEVYHTCFCALYHSFADKFETGQ